MYLKKGTSSQMEVFSGAGAGGQLTAYMLPLVIPECIERDNIPAHYIRIA